MADSETKIDAGVTWLLTDGLDRRAELCWTTEHGAAPFTNVKVTGGVE